MWTLTKIWCFYALYLYNACAILAAFMSIQLTIIFFSFTFVCFHIEYILLKSNVTWTVDKYATGTLHLMLAILNVHKPLKMLQLQRLIKVMFKKLFFL